MKDGGVARTRDTPDFVSSVPPFVPFASWAVHLIPVG